MPEQFDFSTMKKKWPSPIVARKAISQFTGGAISPGTLANEDSRGTGPEGRFQINGKTAYPVEAVVEWLQQKTRNAKAPVSPCCKKREGQ